MFRWKSHEHDECHVHEKCLCSGEKKSYIVETASDETLNLLLVIYIISELLNDCVFLLWIRERPIYFVCFVIFLAIIK